MKKCFSPLFIVGLSLLVLIIVTGCASGPVLGVPTDLQQILNKFDPIPLLGNTVKFDFGGDSWIARVNGENFMAGSCVSENTGDGSILTLKQTHVWGGSAANKAPGLAGSIAGNVTQVMGGWVKMSGPDIVLEYKAGPPPSLSVK